MRYYNYLNENYYQLDVIHRSQNISKEEFIEGVNKKCSDILKYYKKTFNYIYRGLRNPNNFLYIDPTKTTRVSANTENYYTLLFDNILPSWKNMPKRSKSLICTMNSSYSSGYGATFIVFPFNGCKIGMCPCEDLWDSFINSGYDFMLDDFNRDLEQIFNRFNKDISKIESTFKQVSDTIEKFKILRKNGFNNDILLKNNNLFKLYLDKYINKISFFDFINHIMSPQFNKFKIHKIGDNLGYDNEVWFADKAYLTRISDPLSLLG